MLKAPLTKYTKSLLKSIARDYNLSESELVVKYCESEKIPCPHTTAKGTLCKNSCLPEKFHCHLHATIKPTKEPKTKKPTKMSKSHPVHTHPPGACDSSCQLCKTHGDAFNPAALLLKFAVSSQ
jgi:hypothetical protein